jgi:spermidine synthase
VARTQAAPRRVAVRTELALAEVIPEPGRPHRRLLRLDGEDSAHVDLRDPTHLDFTYVRRLGDVVDAIAPARRAIDVVHVGGGGFTLPRYVEATRPGSRSEVAEIDPGILAVAREHLGLRTGPGLRVRVADGRAVLRRRRAESADLVVVDAFVGEEIPAHLATVECAALARRALRLGGIYAVNVIDAPPLTAARELAATLDEVFGHLAIVAARKVIRGRQGGNLVLLASRRALPVDALRTRALRGAAPELVVAAEAARAFVGGARARHD